MKEKDGSQSFAKYRVETYRKRSWHGISRSLDDVGERGNQKDNVEHAMENGTHTIPVHHSLDV